MPGGAVPVRRRTPGWTTPFCERSAAVMRRLRAISPSSTTSVRVAWAVVTSTLPPSSVTPVTLRQMPPGKASLGAASSTSPGSTLPSCAVSPANAIVLMSAAAPRRAPIVLWSSTSVPSASTSPVEGLTASCSME